MERKGTIGLLVVGIVLVAQSFTTMAPSGPWDSSSFTRGIIGLVGLICIYLAWFNHTFGMFGVAPTVNRWTNPETTWIQVVVFGLACLVLTRGIRWWDKKGIIPEPAGMLLALIGILAVMNGLYVWLITNGPLADEEE